MRRCWIDRAWDIIVAGGGNAGLCAAIEAAEAGASTLLLEAAPRSMRGGNSRHTRNFRCMHGRPLSVLEDIYTAEEFLEDLLQVTGGKTDRDLARLTISSSESCLTWMASQGVRFQPSLSGSLSLGRTNAFFLGGGKALVNAYYNRIADLGVAVAYDAEVTKLHIEGRKFTGLDVLTDGENVHIRGKAAVLASGGFQGNLEWLAQAWGPAAHNFLVRGTPYNRGTVLRAMLDHGAETVGDPTQCHAVAIDGRAAKFDGGIVTRLDCVPFSVVVNRQGKRFYDEGEDVWPKRYAIWGRLVAAQPEQIAYAIIDAGSRDLFMPSVYPPVVSNTIEGLCQQLELPVDRVSETIAEFNAACSTGRFTPTAPDGLATSGLNPPKSNWARPIIRPPFCGYPLRPGITFTYLGLKVDSTSRVQIGGKPFHNVWAAGEIMAGSILGEGYLAGFGMTIGTVFGRISGKEAAKHLV